MHMGKQVLYHARRLSLKLNKYSSMPVGFLSGWRLMKQPSSVCLVKRRREQI